MTLESPASEAALIQRATSEPDALAELYRRYQPRIAAYVMRRIGSSHEAEDVVANVFLAMVRGLKNYRNGEAPFVAWLYRIAGNEVNRWFRKRRIRSFFGLSIEIETTQPNSDEVDNLRVALNRLSLIHQEVISLHYLESLSVSEIACILRVSPGTVKSRLARGRDLLRTQLEQEPQPCRTQ